jgi:uncharacterized RDD family membrane protein YckC
MFCKNCGEKLDDNVEICSKCGESSIEVPKNISDTVMPASISKRLLNVLLDGIASWVVSMVFFILAYFSSSPASIVLVILGYVSSFIGYYIVCEYVWGRTVGKLITNTKVIDKFGKKPSFLRIVGRSFARYIPFDFLSFLFGPFPVGWHDSISGTFVVSNDLSDQDAERIDRQKIRLENKSNSSSATIVIVIIVVLFVGIAIIGILSSVVLASLATARAKGSEAGIKSTIASVRLQALVYEDKNKTDVGLCKDPEIVSLLESGSKFGKADEPYVCNDSKNGWAISFPLKYKGYACQDSATRDFVKMKDQITNATSCPAVSPSVSI